MERKLFLTLIILCLTVFGCQKDELNENSDNVLLKKQDFLLKQDLIFDWIADHNYEKNAENENVKLIKKKLIV